MPNSARQHPSPSRRKKVVDGGEPVDAEHSAVLGSEDSGEILTDAPAEESISTPQQVASSHAVELLVRAIEDLVSASRQTAAAGVSAKMRQLEPGFNLQAAGYASFRELVSDARRRGVIASTDSGSDLELQLAHAPRLHRLSDDLWRGFLDWNPGAAKTFDRQTKRVLPDRVAGGVVIESISRTEQASWMEEFATELPVEADRTVLVAAIQKSKDPRDFFAALRSNRHASRQWRNFLQLRVLDRASSWALKNGVPLTDLDDGARTRPTVDMRPEQATDHEDTEARMRSNVLAILGSMPLSELLKLPIPVEYALRT